MLPAGAIHMVAPQYSTKALCVCVCATHLFTSSDPCSATPPPLSTRLVRVAQAQCLPCLCSPMDCPLRSRTGSLGCSTSGRPAVGLRQPPAALSSRVRAPQAAHALCSCKVAGSLWREEAHALCVMRPHPHAQGCRLVAYARKQQAKKQRSRDSGGGGGAPDRRINIGEGVRYYCCVGCLLLVSAYTPRIVCVRPFGLCGAARPENLDELQGSMPSAPTPYASPLKPGVLPACVRRRVCATPAAPPRAFMPVMWVP
jgi:hypothetical protein